MALPQRLCVHGCLLFMCLLLVGLMAAVSSASPIAGPPEALLGKDGDCSKTATSVPEQCSEEFIRALYNENEYKISAYCCMRLFCVGEASCDAVLRSFCPPPGKTPCVRV